MTVGLLNPVISASRLTESATSIKDCNAEAVWSRIRDASFSYFSKYNLTVAPLPAVPESRKMILEPSVKRMRMP